MNEDQINQVPQSEMPKESQIGPVIATVIIILILLIGGLYFWGEQLKKESIKENSQIQIEAGEVSNLENEVNSLEVDSFEQEINNIETEFENL